MGRSLRAVPQRPGRGLNHRNSRADDQSLGLVFQFRCCRAGRCFLDSVVSGYPFYGFEIDGDVHTDGHGSGTWTNHPGYRGGVFLGGYGINRQCSYWSSVGDFDSLDSLSGSGIFFLARTKMGQMKIFPGLCVGAAIVSLIFFPAFISSYWMTFLFTILINSALAGGINLLWGYAGYLNLGYMTFFGWGAYGTAILCLQGWPFLTGLGICLILLLPVAGLMSLPLFRLQGLYFSVATLGILILLEDSAGKILFLSGGQEGLSLPLGNHAWECYLLSLALACFSLGANLLINKQKLGFQLRMIQEDEATAQSVGIPVLSSKIKAYLLGATIALLAGGIYVRQVGYIGPSSAFGLPVAMPPVIMALIGGGQRWWGPLLGAIILTGLQEILWTGLDRWVLSGYGMVLILLGIFWSGFDQGETMRRVVHK